MIKKKLYSKLKSNIVHAWTLNRRKKMMKDLKEQINIPRNGRKEVVDDQH